MDNLKTINILEKFRKSKEKYEKVERTCYPQAETKIVDIDDIQEYYEEILRNGE